VFRADPELELAIQRVAREGGVHNLVQAFQALQRKFAPEYREWARNLLRRVPLTIFARRLEWTTSMEGVENIHEAFSKDRHVDMDVAHYLIGAELTQESAIKPESVMDRRPVEEAVWDRVTLPDGSERVVCMVARISYLKKSIMRAFHYITPDQFGDLMAQLLMDVKYGIFITPNRLRQHPENRPIHLALDRERITHPVLVAQNPRLEKWHNPIEKVRTAQEMKHMQRLTRRQREIYDGKRIAEMDAYVERVNQLIDSDKFYFDQVAQSLNALGRRLWPEATGPECFLKAASTPHIEEAASVASVVPDTLEAELVEVFRQNGLSEEEAQREGRAAFVLHKKAQERRADAVTVERTTSEAPAVRTAREGQVRLAMDAARAEMAELREMMATEEDNLDEIRMELDAAGEHLLELHERYLRGEHVDEEGRMVGFPGFPPQKRSLRGEGAADGGGGSGGGVDGAAGAAGAGVEAEVEGEDFEWIVPDPASTVPEDHAVNRYLQCQFTLDLLRDKLSVCESKLCESEAQLEQFK